MVTGRMDNVRPPARAGRLALVVGSLVVILALLVVKPASAGWLRPVAGAGNFHLTCDLVTLPRADGRQDVVVLLAVPNAEVTFESESGRPRGRLRATATITALDGRRFREIQELVLTARDDEDARSATLVQSAAVVIGDVDAVGGTFDLLVEDLNRRRPGFAFLGTEHKAMSTASADWYAPPARAPHGLAVGDAIFLAHAPIGVWERNGRPAVPGAEGPWDYVNPSRRYGLEAERLQIYFTVEPPALAADRRRAAGRDLRVEIASSHLDFSLVDTLRLAPSVREALAEGRPAAIYWDVDAGGLPPGAFRLGIAPLDTAGRGLLTGFDMVWSMGRLTRDVDDLLGEGRTVLMNSDLEAFEAAPLVEKEQIVAEFWRALDPTPEDSYNEIYAEFRRRVAAVDAYFGGWGADGAADPRGRIYLLLGEPDSIREEAVPLNEQDLNDARIMVYERYAPERLGNSVKGSSIYGTDGEFTTERANMGTGVIPMPYSYMADTNIRANVTAVDTRTFVLWRYDGGGDHLFPNSYEGQGQGLRFLFVDKFGNGEYVIDSDNTRLMGD